MSRQRLSFQVKIVLKRESPFTLMKMSLSAEDKRRILKALEEDQEFRLRASWLARL